MYPWATAPLIGIRRSSVLEFLSGSELEALATVIMIDIVMSGDNAIVIGMAAAGLPPELRRRAIFIGIAAATVLRISFAVVTLQLLAIIGLTLAGGLLLAWVCWQMWRDIRSGAMTAPAAGPVAVEEAPKKRKTLRQALLAIVFADVSMSLDNVLAVAGAAREHLAIIGLTLAGGLLLAWVCWQMWRDIRVGAMTAPVDGPVAVNGAPKKRKTLRQALLAIIFADVSMSLDNVLAVAGAAREHLTIMVFGLVLSIALMAVASNYIAKLLERHHWIAYVGLVIVAYVAIGMIVDGVLEVSEVAL